MVEVTSSNIKAIDYKDGELIVEYLSGAIYKYKNVPRERFKEFMESESKGRYMNESIKGHYEYERVVNE